MRHKGHIVDPGLIPPCVHSIGRKVVMKSASLILNQGPAPACTHQPVLERVLQPPHKVGLWLDRTQSWPNVKLTAQTWSKSVAAPSQSSHTVCVVILYRICVPLKEDKRVHSFISNQRRMYMKNARIHT